MVTYIGVFRYYCKDEGCMKGFVLELNRVWIKRTAGLKNCVVCELEKATVCDL